MGICVTIMPRVVVSWDCFKSQYPKYSVALDGFVAAKTIRDPLSPQANFDHHSDVDRISTRSTAEQVYMEIKLGLFDTFHKNKIPEMNIFINDCDEDTALAVWLLKNHERFKGQSEPLINRLVYCNDRLDTTAGSYPFGDIEILRIMAWIFEPYRKARAEGYLHSSSSEMMKTILEAVMARITKYSLGQFEQVALEGSFDVIGGGPGWSMVKEASTLARMFMFHKGIDAFVSSLGSNRYVIGKKSMWTKFPVELLIEVLNNAEKPGLITETNRWGGSNTIIGSPRLTGSGFSEIELQDVINEFLKRYVYV